MTIRVSAGRAGFARSRSAASAFDSRLCSGEIRLFSKPYLSFRAASVPSALRLESCRERTRRPRLSARGNSAIADLSVV